MPNGMQAQQIYNILSLSTSWRWDVNFMHQQLYTHESNLVPIEWEVMWAQSQSGHQKENALPLREYEPWPVQSLYQLCYLCSSVCWRKTLNANVKTARYNSQKMESSFVILITQLFREIRWTVIQLQASKYEQLIHYSYTVCKLQCNL